MHMPIVYWSGTGNTAAMAEHIAAGAQEAGTEVRLLEVGSASAADIEQADLVALGCPAMGAEVLEESEFEPYWQAVKGLLKGKKLALFGSYGWGDGAWMRTWQDEAIAAGANLFGGEGLMANYAPDETECKTFGANFAKA